MGRVETCDVDELTGIAEHIFGGTWQWSNDTMICTPDDSYTGAFDPKGDE